MSNIFPLQGHQVLQMRIMVIVTPTASNVPSHKPLPNQDNIGRVNRWHRRLQAMSLHFACCEHKPRGRGRKEACDLVPADGRLLAACDFFGNETPLTVNRIRRKSTWSKNPSPLERHSR